MKKTVIALSISSLIVFGCNVSYAIETEDPSALVALLSNPNKETRATAAAAMRRLIAADPSSRTNDHGEKYWKKRVESVTPGMNHSNVMRLLPAYDHTLSAERLLWSGPGTGDSHTAMWRLDHHWTVTIQYRNPDKVIERPTLENKAMRVWVKPPEGFSGTWETWYVNGLKSHGIEYKNGKYHGAFIAFYDNGHKCYQQHYRNGKCSGSDSGWYPDGSKMYHGNYTDGKQTGTWTHWFPDGSVRSRCEYRDGKWHGTWTTWREDGNRKREVSYRNGKKHGIDREWDKSGKLLWSRHFENGELMRSDPIDETAEPGAGLALASCRATNLKARVQTKSPVVSATRSQVTPLEPKITLFDSVKRVEQYLKTEAKQDYSDKYLHSVTHRYSEGHPRKGACWLYHFAFKKPRRGGDISIYHFMDGEIIEFHHGP